MAYSYLLGLNLRHVKGLLNLGHDLPNRKAVDDPLHLRRDILHRNVGCHGPDLAVTYVSHNLKGNRMAAHQTACDVEVPFDEVVNRQGELKAEWYAVPHTIGQSVMFATAGRLKILTHPEQTIQPPSRT